MTADQEFERVFPSELLRATIAQASSWTCIGAIVRAARVIEERADEVSPYFVLAFPDDDVLQSIIVRVLGYLIPEYRCSAEKLAIARRVDPLISTQTLQKLAATRLDPEMSVGGPSFVREAMPQLAELGPVRVLKVVDDPAMVELIFEPFQMLRTTLVALYTEARKWRSIDRAAAKTSGEMGSNRVHRPYGDGALVATLDALVYFALGFRVGVQWGIDQVSVETGFRCFNVVGQPPLSPRNSLSHAPCIGH